MIVKKRKKKETKKKEVTRRVYGHCALHFVTGKLLLGNFIAALCTNTHLCLSIPTFDGSEGCH